MEFHIKEYYREIVVFAVFFFSIMALGFSGLSAEKAISYPNEVSGLFLSELQNVGIVSAVLSASASLAFEVVLPLLPFLVLVSSGFAMVLYFKPDNKRLIFALVGVAVLSVLLNPSLIIVFACLGLFMLVLPLSFDEKEGFRNGYSFSSKMIRYLGIFIVAGLFFSVYNLPDFESLAKERIVLSMTSLIPNSDEIAVVQKDAAKEFVTQAAVGVSSHIDSEYLLLNESVLSQCSEVKDAVKSGVENYKDSVISEIDNGTMASINLEDQISEMEMMSSLAKAYPFMAAFMLFFLLEFLRPVVSLAGGGVYYILNRRP